MIYRGIIPLLLLFFQALPATSNAQPAVKVTIQVVDEQGLPVEDAMVGVGFMGARPAGESWGSSQFTEQDSTDDDGIAVFSDSALGHVTYSAIKDGYYRSNGSYAFSNISGFYGFRKWQPYNPTLKLTLKKIVEPVPLYARQFTGGFGEKFLVIPETGNPVGFDLMKGDWVAPHGMGTHHDFIFEFTGEVKSDVQFDVSLKLTFPNEYDGIQAYSAPVNTGSMLRLPHKAPESGYNRELTQRYASNPHAFIHKDFPDERNYFFRTRTEVDNKGNIISAHYGKIHGNITFNEQGQIGMTYYINPEFNDHNLEFEPGKNLYKSTAKQSRTPLLP